MKRFISISLLTAAAIIEAVACAVPQTHNWYLFSVLQEDHFSQTIQEQFMANWSTYTGGQMSPWWFDAEAVSNAARRKGDQLMLSYLDYLDRYLQQAQMVETESWDYPTKQDLNDQREEILAIREYATGQLGSRLRSQHALLLMRCNMLLGEHEQNVAFWEQKGSQMINSAYRDMMRNIYAGALLKTGRTDEATQIFIEQGDLASLYTYYYDKRSYEFIARVFAGNPDSPALPFLLQDFANNAQEAVDGLDKYNNWPGKLYINSVARGESEQMQQLCRQALKDGQTGEPALWKSLEAWLLYLGGDGQQALKAIGEAMTLKGSEATMDNARVLRLYITADAGKPADDFMAEELAWLEKCADETRRSQEWYDDRFTHVFDRLAHKVVVSRYMDRGRPEVALAFMAAHDDMERHFYEKHRNGDGEDYDWNDSYSSDFFQVTDTVDAAMMERYLSYVNGRSGKSALDKWLLAHIDSDELFLHEAVGTKYLREGEWQKAIDHLEQVPLRFINGMNIAPFMAQRSYSVEPWMHRQWIKERLQQPGAVAVSTNQKLDFAREMQQMEQRYAQAKGAERQQLAFDLAVRYYQASLYGDAWYITEYGKSSYSSPDKPKPAFVVKARQLLEEAAKSDDYALRERATYAQAFAPFDNWHEYEWSSSENKIVAIPLKNTEEYAAMKRLDEFARKNSASLSSYVSRCDILKQFRKGH